MKKQIITLLGFLCSLTINAQTNITSNSFDKKKAEQLIVGQWQQTELSVKSDQIKGFNEAMDNPMVRTSFKTLTNGASLQFDPGGKAISIILSGVDTSHYQISDDGSVTISSKKKNKLLRKHKILELTNDTLIYTTNMKTNSPDLLQLLSSLHLKKDTTKTVTYTYTYYRIKEANAPWAAINDNLPKKSWVENLVANDSTFFAIVSDPSGENNDSIFASNNYCTNWSYGGYTIPKSDAEGKIIGKLGSKIFVATETGVFATEKNGTPWVKMRGLPEATFFGLEKPQFGTTATRIYGGIGAKLFASSDNGNTWDSVTTPLKDGDILMTLAVNESNIIVGGMSVTPGAQSNGDGTFLLLSTDEGRSWQNIQFSSEDYPGIMAGYVAIAGSSIFMNTQYGMFRSGLQPINWIPVKDVAFTPANNAFSPLAQTGISGNAMLAKGLNIFYGGARGIFFSDNGGESWTDVNNKELRKGVNSFVIANDQIIALTTESKLFRASVNDLVEYRKKMGR